MSSPYVLVILLLCSVMFASVLLQKLTFTGAVLGGCFGFLIFLCADFTGVFMLGTFFILGSGATSWKLKYKQSEGLAELNKGRRTPGQVFANSGVPALLSVICFFIHDYEVLLRLMIAASIAAATADTLSSELGNIYGSRFYNIISFRKDQKGLNGVVSIEGSLLGIAGSLAIALVYGLGWGLNMHLLIITVSGVLGNLMDSILGASLERAGKLNNNAVNFFNTLSGAVCALLLNYCLS